MNKGFDKKKALAKWKSFFDRLIDDNKKIDEYLQTLKVKLTDNIKVGNNEFVLDFDNIIHLEIIYYNSEYEASSYLITRGIEYDFNARQITIYDNNMVNIDRLISLIGDNIYPKYSFMLEDNFSESMLFNPNEKAQPLD